MSAHFDPPRQTHTPTGGFLHRWGLGLAIMVGLPLVAAAVILGLGLTNGSSASSPPPAFKALDCTGVIHPEPGVFQCVSEGGTAMYWRDPNVEAIVRAYRLSVPTYNPDGDVFYTDDSGGLFYVPGSPHFFEGSDALVGPDSEYHLHVVDTDVL
jgi:hypothetical protein